MKTRNNEGFADQQTDLALVFFHWEYVHHFAFVPRL